MIRTQHSVPVSFKTQYRSHRSAPSMPFSARQHPIASAYSYSESECLDTVPFAYVSLDVVSVGTILFASVFWTSIPDSTHLPDITILVCAHPGIAHPISADWYAEYLGINYQIPPYRYAVYFGNVHHVSPYWYVNACINKQLPIAAYHLADTHTRCQKIPAR